MKTFVLAGALASTLITGAALAQDQPPADADFVGKAKEAEDVAVKNLKAAAFAQGS